MVLKVCLHIWMTHESVLRKGKHTSAIWKLFSQLTNGLAINLEKCVFATPSLESLRHKISATGAAPMADHAAQNKNCPPPQHIKLLKLFLSMVNFYCRFLPNCGQVLKPLTNLLTGGGGGQNVGVDCFCPGGIPKCLTPPSSRGAPPTSCPKH
jgi:hypothetical protein